MTRTPKTLFIGLLLLGSLAIFTAPILLPFDFAFAVERTGEVLRELLQSVEQDFAALERETRGIAKRTEDLTKQLEEKSKLLGREQDPVRKEALGADMLYLSAQLNELDVKDVEAALTTVSQVRGKLDRIREVLRRGGNMPPAEDLPRVRGQLGKFLSTAAGFLDKWEKSSPEKKAEIAALKASLLGTLNTWESPTSNIGSSQEELTRTLRAFDATYGQLLTLSRSLEQEKQILSIKNQTAAARLAILRLNGGKVSIGSVLDTVEGKRKGIERRREILKGTDGGGPIGDGGDSALGSDQESTYNRMKRGEFQWPKGDGK